VMTSLTVVHDAMSVVVIGEPSPPAPERVVHVVRPAVADDKLLELLRALASGRAIAEPPDRAGPLDDKVRAVADKLSRLTDRGAIETISIEAITTLVAADRAHCLFHDPSTGALWSEARRRSSRDDRRAMGGLVGWAAHTGRAIHASPAGDDPRWLQELDDPSGKAQSRLLVQPVIGADRRVHAVPPRVAGAVPTSPPSSESCWRSSRPSLHPCSISRSRPRRPRHARRARPWRVRRRPAGPSQRANPRSSADRVPRVIRDRSP
jgi:hypothetical protein